MAIAFANATATDIPSTTSGDAETLGTEAQRHFGSTEVGKVPAETGGANRGFASQRVVPGPKPTPTGRDARFHVFRRTESIPLFSA